MKNTTSLPISAACAILLNLPAFAGTPAITPASKPAYEASIYAAYTNEYIFRGAEYGDDLVEVGVSASTEWNGLGFSGSIWYGSVQSSRLVDSPLSTVIQAPSHYSELDLTGEVNKDLGFLTAHLGYIWRHYDSVELTFGPFNGFKLIDDQQEIYFGVSRELYWGIEGALTYFWDVEYDNGGYTELGFTKSFEINDRSSIDLASKTGYLVEDGELSYTQLVASYNYKVTDTATLTPFVGISIELDDADQAFSNFNLRGATGMDNPQGNQIYGGVKLAVAF